MPRFRSKVIIPRSLAIFDRGCASGAFSVCHRVRDHIITPDRILLCVTVDVETEVDVSVGWDDYQKYEDVREFFRGDDGEPFGEASAEYPLGITVAMSLIVSADAQRVLSGDIDWYETELGTRAEINPHPEDGPVGPGALKTQ